jgi:hypothetical protein
MVLYEQKGLLEKREFIIDDDGVKMRISRPIGCHERHVPFLAIATKPVRGLCTKPRFLYAGMVMVVISLLTAIPELRPDRVHEKAWVFWFIMGSVFLALYWFTRENYLLYGPPEEGLELLPDSDVEQFMKLVQKAKTQYLAKRFQRLFDRNEEVNVPAELGNLLDVGLITESDYDELKQVLTGMAASKPKPGFAAPVTA